MPATYSHRYTYEQLTGRGRNTWKKPEQPPTQKERLLAGFVVDDDTYRKYDRMTWDLGDGVDRSIYGVRVYATSAELAEYNPELAAKAKKLFAQIEKEIYGKDKRKDDKSMSTPKKSVEFIAALEELYNNHRAEYGELAKKLSKAKDNQERCEKERAKNPGDRLVSAKYDVAKGEYLIAQDDFRKAIRNLQDKHNIAVNELRGQFATFLDESYAANPDALDDKTIALLNSGICSASELHKLAERHANNPTMLRMISTHAEKLRTSKWQTNENKEICAKVLGMAREAKNGDRELAVFDNAVGACERGLQTDAQLAERMHNYIAGWFGDFKNQVETLPYAPASGDA